MAAQPKTAPHPNPATSLGPRNRIVSEARRHFMAHGFRGITMDDLATELGMSKKTLYAHFASKTALVEAVVAQKFGDLDTHLHSIVERSPDNVGKALHDMVATLLKEASEVQPAFMRDVQREAPEIFALIQERRQALLQRHFGKILGPGQKSGLVRRDIRAPLIIEVLLGAVESIVTPARLSELRLEPRVAVSAILKILLEGALTEEGRRKL